MHIDFNKNKDGLVPVIVQDIDTKMVLMQAYMNEEALQKTIETNQITFFSRSKNRLWTKGETSGNFLIAQKIIPDCDNDAILIYAKPKGVVCHTGNDTCFAEKNELNFLDKLQNIIKERKNSTNENSYTKKLFEKGINKIAQKVGEEAVEVVIEAKDNNLELFKNECADLLFHYLILLEAKNTSLEDIINVLKERHQ
ncbi:MAG: bifunctional phosphoribosyl-AMP cyclohydrolase/phosphoribosyl-ATP diphosphatase HisIE [Bacteroidetes bacterium]|nr:MAG: bifunctional phosphoribosyl-AMP cyclohydrolase/phosphoribosyl-ATP diphosphatase HisIE [Bacteroidota bacterium]